jgi:hypothetical protein
MEWTMDGKDMNDREEKIRQRAYEIWQREGCPEGRAEEHWQMARTEIAMAEDQATATRPVPRTRRRSTRPEAEPIEVVENLGSFPTLTDQDEEQGTPKRRSRGARIPKPHKD